MLGTESTIKSRISVDTSEINKLMAELRFSDREARTAVKAGLRDSANIIKKAAIQRLSGISSDRQKRKGVKAVIYKNASGAQVNIYTPFYINRDGKQRIFMLRWFEEGTKDSAWIQNDRLQYNHWKSKSGKFHKGTAPKPFFASSVQASKSQAESVLSDCIIKRIEKVASKRK